MRGIFCRTNARNNEEYKEELKKRMKGFVGGAVIGIITALLGFGAHALGIDSANERMAGVIAGVGTGIFAGMMVLWLKTWQILKDEKRIQEERLEQSDERLQEISSRAYRAAATVMLASLYILCLAGGFFYPVLVKILLIIVAVFLLTYLAAYKIYQHKI